MRKRILSFITLLLLVITTTVPTYANNQKNDSDIYYTTQHGVELTQTQYENLTKVYTPEELDCLPIPFIERNKNDDQLRLADSDEAYVVTQTLYDDNNQPVNTINKEVSETEAMMLANLPKTTLSNSWETSTKKITIKVVLGASISTKRITLINKWLSLPKVRSFDVLAIRPSAASISLLDSEFDAAQNYDNKSINYSFYGDNTKKLTGWTTGQGGIGTSMNIVDDVSTSLSNSMAITLLTGALPFTVYGTYQHATSDLTLSQSQNYTFSSSGLGGVLKFANSVSSKYDGMKGVSATCALP